MTQTHAELGMNRTGIATSPRLSKDMIKGTSEFPPPTLGDERAIGDERAAQARIAETVGSVPPPLTGRGVLSTAGTALKGESPTQLIDKLGERLAFERTGTRLYEALLSKYDALGGFEGGPSRAEIEEIVADEHAHFAMLNEVLAGLGADPTVMTTSADIQATLSKGIVEVMVDPRTTLPQCLEAALLAELADNDCWLALAQLASSAGQDALTSQFTEALATEQKHLSRVRAWIAASQGRDAQAATLA